jgi:hypothetical protein
MLGVVQQAAAAEQVLIPYGATGYRYQVVSHGQGAGFEAPGFDDSGWYVGDAAFGGGPFQCTLDAPRRTEWPPNTDILLRKTFDMPLGSNVSVGVAIDNDVEVFVNGHSLGPLFKHENCATYDSKIFPVDPSFLVTGTNVLAVRGIDRGGVSLLDVRLTQTPPLDSDGDGVIDPRTTAPWYRTPIRRTRMRTGPAMPAMTTTTTTRSPTTWTTVP